MNRCAALSHVNISERASGSRFRHAATASLVSLAPGSRRDQLWRRGTLVEQTLYQCPSRDERFLGQQRCADCDRFYRARALNRDAVEHRLAKYATLAAQTCPSWPTKRISAHVLRHTAAMQLLHAGVDTSVIALWLGHERVETTQIYLHADPSLQEQALARTRPPATTPGRFRPSDTLLAFLESL